MGIQSSHTWKAETKAVTGVAQRPPRSSPDESDCP